MPKKADIPADQPDDLGPLAASNIETPVSEEAELPPLAASAPPPRRIPITVIGAVAAAGLVGVTVGLALAPGTRTPAPSAPDQMKVLVETKPAPTPPIGPPMPTLQGLPAPAAPAPQVKIPPPAVVRSAAVAPPSAVATQVPAPPVARTDPADVACAYAASDPASGCADADIVAIDRELYAAYQEARRVGVPARELREDQQDWRVASAAAADESRAALLEAYRGRVAQVWAMVEAWDERGDRRFGRPRLR